MCSMMIFFFKQKTAYEMRISDWSSDVCSSDLHGRGERRRQQRQRGDQPNDTWRKYDREHSRSSHCDIVVMLAPNQLSRWYAGLRFRTASIITAACSGCVCCRIPWPRLKTWPAPCPLLASPRWEHRIVGKGCVSRAISMWLVSHKKK